MPTASLIRPPNSLGRVEPDQRSERGLGQARVAGDERSRLARQRIDERVRDALVDDDALRRHANLALVHEGAEGGGLHGLAEIGVVEHDERRLAAEFEEDRLQMTRRRLRDGATDPRRPREIDAPDGRMGDQGIDDPRSVGRRIADDVDDTLAETGIAHRLADEVMHARTDFGRLQDGRVAAGERHRDRADAEDDGRVPRRDAENDADRLAHREGRQARKIGRKDLPGDLRDGGGGLAQHARGERHVEPCPSGRRSGLRGHRRHEIGHPRLEGTRRTHQPLAPQSRTQRRPGGKGPGCGGRGGGGIGDGGGRGAARKFAGYGIEPFEDETVGSGSVAILHEERHVEHRHTLPSRRHAR